MMPFNETILVIILTFCVSMLFNRLVALTVHNAMLQQNPDLFAKAVRHCNRLDTLRDLIISEQISFSRAI
jgi:hypothetical protein